MCGTVYMENFHGIISLSSKQTGFLQTTAYSNFIMHSEYAAKMVLQLPIRLSFKTEWTFSQI